MSDEKRIIEMDIRGQICPSCLLLVLKEINANIQAIKKATAELCVFTDDRHATATIPDAVAKMGLVTSIEKEKGGFLVRIFKG